METDTRHQQNRSQSNSMSKAEYEQLAAFRHTLRQFLRFSERAAHLAGLAPRQHQALLAVAGFPGRERLTIGELAEQLQIKPHSAVGLVNRLVATGLLEREPDTSDRRQVYVELTERGKDTLRRLSAAHRAELRRIGPGLKVFLEALSQTEPDKE